MYAKVCVECGSRFWAHRESTLCCSKACSAIHSAKKKKIYQDNKTRKRREAKAKEKREREVCERIMKSGNEWLIAYTQADDLGKKAMIADANGMKYSELQTFQIRQPIAYLDMVRETVATKMKES